MKGSRLLFIQKKTFISQVVAMYTNASNVNNYELSGNINQRNDFSRALKRWEMCLFWLGYVSKQDLFSIIIILYFNGLNHSLVFWDITHRTGQLLQLPTVRQDVENESGLGTLFHVPAANCFAYLKEQRYKRFTCVQNFKNKEASNTKWICHVWEVTEVPDKDSM